ncbi:MAG: hypothetical protein OZSIB_0184 [Candidatus Ozemobacter sibiricus]|jgi:hypothetical protein|uniref:Zinc-finger domain-containing protein n=1 Tax=Candidatus Ozemobacter sibiricus TaxID=2268124 RepID=A0A367ZMG9_9BACT|nr:MAG: hypothetical protein OZSIB_0184 [Candidatus Ozemobacter sibiricus]
MSQSGECERIQDALIDGQGAGPAVRQHLAGCSVCREFQRRLGDLQGLGSLYRPEAFAAGAARIKNLIHQTPFPGEGSSGASPSAGSAASGASAGSAAAAGAGAAGGLGWLGSLSGTAVAVMVAAALAIGGWWASRPRERPGSEPWPAVSSPVGATGSGANSALTASPTMLASPSGAIASFLVPAPASVKVEAPGPGADVDADR